VELRRASATALIRPPDDREALLAWLTEADRKAWDGQISRDFSEGGVGMRLLAEIDGQIRRGNFRPLAGDGIRTIS